MKPHATATAAAAAPVTASTALPVDARRRAAAASEPVANFSGSSTAVCASIIPAAVAAPTMPTTTPPSTSAYNFIAPPPPPPPTAPPNLRKNTLFHPKFFQLTIIHVSEYCKNIGIVIHNICSACRNAERSQESSPSLSASWRQLYHILLFDSIKMSCSSSRIISSHLLGSVIMKAIRWNRMPIAKDLLRLKRERLRQSQRKVVRRLALPWRCDSPSWILTWKWTTRQQVSLSSFQSVAILASIIISASMPSQ